MLTDQSIWKKREVCSDGSIMAVPDAMLKSLPLLYSIDRPVIDSCGPWVTPVLEP